MGFALLCALIPVLFASSGFAQTFEINPGPCSVFGTLKITTQDESRLPSSIVIALQPDSSTMTSIGQARRTDSVRVKNHGQYRFDKIPRGYWFLIVFAENRAIYKYQLKLEPNSPYENQVDLEFRWDMEIPPNARSVSNTDSYARNPSNATFFHQATAARMNKDYAKAANLLRTVVNADPKDFEAWTDLGTVLFRLGNKPEAKKAYRRALSEDPSYPVALLNYGKLQYDQKDYELSIQSLSQLVETHPASAEAHRFLGEAYLGIKKGSKAAPELQEAVRLDPEHQAEAYLSLGALYDAAGLKEKAAEVYVKYLVLKPDCPIKAELSKYIQSQK
jgi:Flp pilus assembly protein TadD